MYPSLTAEDCHIPTQPLNLFVSLEIIMDLYAIYNLNATAAHSSSSSIYFKKFFPIEVSSCLLASKQRGQLNKHLYALYTVHLIRYIHTALRAI
jgi:hypothetical protein